MLYASVSFGDAPRCEQSLECRHRSSKSLSSQLTRGFPSLALTSLWRSHTHRDRDARESTRGGDARESTRKSARHVAHGYKSPSASKNRRACTRCVAVGTSWARGGKERNVGVSSVEARRRTRDAPSTRRRGREARVPGNAPPSCVTARKRIQQRNTVSPVVSSSSRAHAPRPTPRVPIHPRPMDTTHHRWTPHDRTTSSARRVRYRPRTWRRTCPLSSNTRPHRTSRPDFPANRSPSNE